MKTLAPLCALVLVPAALTAQTSWSQVTGTMPTPRNQIQVPYMFQQGKHLLFGGLSGAGMLNDTWTFDGATWTQEAPASSPSNRAGYSAAYDLVNDKVFIFGGWNGGSYQRETWEWDGSTWTNLAPATQPPRGDWGALVYDAAHGVMVYFGGHDWQLVPNSSDQTWLFDGASKTWTQESPTTVPGSRFGHAMAFHAIRGTVMMFGGAVAGIGRHNDLWEWNGGTKDWTQITTATQPAARFFHTLAYDHQRGRLVLTGGRDLNNVVLGDVWEFDGTDWVQRAPQTNATPVAWAATDYDFGNRVMMRFGGSPTPSKAPMTDETWTYGPAVQATATAFGAGCVGTNGQVPTMDCSSLAWVGGSYDLAVNNARANSFAIFAYGTSNSVVSGTALTLPLNLGIFGLTGCTLFADPEFQSPLRPTSNSGNATFSVAIPNLSAFLGLTAYGQAFVIDLGAPKNMVVADACEHLVGGQ